MEIIFICTGNTCRSPMAEAYMKKITGKNSFKSAGTDAYDGLSASENSILTLKDLDIDLNEHRSQRVTRGNLEKADLILTMTLNHKQKLLQNYPDLHSKIYTLKEYVKEVNLNEVVLRIKEIEGQIIEKKEAFFSSSPIPSEDEKEEFLKNIENDLEEVNDLYDILEELDIKDPFGGDIEAYKLVFKEIKENIDYLILKTNN